jgi:DNA-binding transcriptional regulator YhcF (GntR family)
MNTVHSVYQQYDFGAIIALVAMLVDSENPAHRELAADLEDAMDNIEDVFGELEAEGFFDPSY